MAKVIAHNGVTGGTADGFTKYRFSGSPTDQFEHRGEVGEVRSMSVTVECVAEGYDQVADGVRHQTKWRVTNATLGDPVERPADPQLSFDEDDQGAQYGDYSATEAGEVAGVESNVVPFSDRADTVD